jgi:hypothetical protein
MPDRLRKGRETAPSFLLIRKLSLTWVTLIRFRETYPSRYGAGLEFGRTISLRSPPNPSFLGRSVMIQELTRSHYWGVLCSRCKERISVPKRVAVLHDDLKHGEVTNGQDISCVCYFEQIRLACSKYGGHGLLLNPFRRAVREATGYRAFWWIFNDFSITRSH